LTSTLDGVNGQRHASAAVYPRKGTPGTRSIGGWVGPSAGLYTDTRGKILCFAEDQLYSSTREQVFLLV